MAFEALQNGNDINDLPFAAHNECKNEEIRHHNWLRGNRFRFKLHRSSMRTSPLNFCRFPHPGAKVCKDRAGLTLLCEETRLCETLKVEMPNKFDESDFNMVGA